METEVPKDGQRAAPGKTVSLAPTFFGLLATGYADVPVVMFVAAGAVASARRLLDEETSWLALATVFFSGSVLSNSVLSNNEGQLFAVAVGRRKAVAVSATIVALIYAPWRTYVVVHDLGAPDYDLSSSFDFPWVVGRLDRAPIAAEGLLQQATELDQFGILLFLGIACIVVTLAIGPRSLGLLAAGFTALSFAGLVWIYVLTPNEVSSYLATNGNRVIVSLVMGLAALSPLLIEESVRGLEGAPSRQGIVGTSS